MLATRHAYLKQCLSALVGLIALTGMTPNAPAQCQSQKFTASDGTTDDFFGSSVAVNGATAIIGAWGNDDLGSNSGSAYVFERVSGAWTEIATLTAADGASGDQLGFSVAIGGVAAVIGAPFDDDLATTSGSAYVFEKVGTTWTQTAKLTAGDGAFEDLFGHSVAVSGDTALIGAVSDDDLGTNSGSAYVFEKVSGVWTQIAKLNASDGAAHDSFGSSVAVSGAAMVIGAFTDDDLGSAYVFEKVADVWTQFAKLNADDGATGVWFGRSVAISGDTAVIGALSLDDLGGVFGSAYVFEKVAGVWAQIAKLNAADVAADDDFGRSVAVSGDTVVIGDFEDDDLGTNSGSAYVFEKVSGVWTQVGKLNASDGAADARFGFSVAISGGTTIIGASGDDDLGTNSGSAHAFQVGGGDCNKNSISDACDIANGTSTDCNGDGIPDDCESDSDGDGVIDDCDPCPLDNPDDTDGDGVCDADDVCAGTPLGLLVELDGCTLAEGPCCFFGGTVCIDGTDRQTCEAFPDGVFQGEGLTCGDPDGDWIVGCSDGCPLDPAKADPGVCGCGVSDNDGDWDGVADCNDRCSLTPFGLPVNDCGCAEVGACCASGGGCFDGIERTVCLAIAGIYQGDGSTCANDCTFGDRDGDGDVDLGDVGAFQRCFAGRGGEVEAACMPFDVDGCGSIDLDDFAALMVALTGPAGGGGPPPHPPVCGNGVLESGEGCDDGNTVPGDGCDESCQLEPGFCGDGILAVEFEECDDGNNVSGDGCDANCMLERPPNDDCADAIAVIDGDTEFNNIWATTDGPDEPTACDFGFGVTQIDADVWFCYEATCSGTVTASLCGSDYDTKLAVYNGCTCPPTGQPLACSDDDCGAGTFTSRLTFSAVQGQSYLIRIGGFTVGSQGTGTLALRCDVQPLCDVAAGDCFAAGGNGSPGCDDASCCDTTCAADPFCCDVTWDATCAAEAQGLCTGSFSACSTSAGACDADNGRAGCADESCCNMVCAVDPFCCVDTWDGFCADEAAGICGLNCGTTGALRNNACDAVAVPGVDDPVAGCSDEKTCKNVCTIAPECCLEAWGQKCVCLADPSDSCCVAVCAEDAFCCDIEWDDLCDQAATDLCTP